MFNTLTEVQVKPNSWSNVVPPDRVKATYLDFCHIPKWNVLLEISQLELQRKKISLKYQLAPEVPFTNSNSPTLIPWFAVKASPPNFNVMF